MALPLFQEMRLSPRKKLSGLLPGKLTEAKTGRAVSCRPIDVSRDGLGVLSSQEIATGSTLVLMANGVPIELHVAWGQPDFGKQDLYRYGLVTNDSNVDLVKAFTESGCLVI